MADDPHRAPCGRLGALHSGDQTRGQPARALGVEADSGHEGPVTDAPQPAVKFDQVSIAAEETGDKDDSAAIAAGHAQAVVDGREAERHPVEGPEGLMPDWRDA